MLNSIKSITIKIPTNILFYFFQTNTHNIYFFFSKNGKIRFLLKKHNLINCFFDKNLLKFEPTKMFVTQVTNSIHNNKYSPKHIKASFLEISRLFHTYSIFFSKLFFDLNNRFKIVLDLRGIGYRFIILNSKIVFFYWGLCHPVKFIVPDNLLISSLDDKNKNLVLESIDRHLVMQTAFLILKMRKFNIYNGKGICFLNEHKITKIGKKASVKK